MELDDGRPYWQRHYGIGVPWNRSGLAKFGAFTAPVLAAMALVLALISVVAWLTGGDSRTDTSRCPSAAPGETVVVDVGGYGEPDECHYSDDDGRTSREPVVAGPTP